jgi:hypothetical protein
MLKGHRFAMRVGRTECRGKALPYFDGIHSDTPLNKGEDAQASCQREYDCFHCPRCYTVQFTWPLCLAAQTGLSHGAPITVEKIRISPITVTDPD